MSIQPHSLDPINDPHSEFPIPNSHFPFTPICGISAIRGQIFTSKYVLCFRRRGSAIEKLFRCPAGGSPVVNVEDHMARIRQSHPEAGRSGFSARRDWRGLPEFSRFTGRAHIDRTKLAKIARPAALQSLIPLTSLDAINSTRAPLPRSSIT